MGSITVLAGDPGLGKSLLSLDLAASLSRGELGLRSAGDVLLLTAEDSRSHTVRPRLEVAGADLTRVHFGGLCRDGFETALVLPNDVGELRGLIESTRARLVVIDPLMAHLAANVNSWKDQMVRQALAPLNALADATAFLDRALADGPRPVQELKAEAERFGITEQTLIRAKQKLGVDSVKLDFGRGWTWQSPEKADDAAGTWSSN